jgi:hypothetical protein
MVQLMGESNNSFNASGMSLHLIRETRMLLSILSAALIRAFGVSRQKTASNKTMTKTLFFAIGFLLFTNIAFGCSYERLPVFDNPSTFSGILLLPVPKPAPYVFIGEVVEIIKVTKPQPSENRTDAEGLKVKVIESIYPSKAAPYYEVVPLGMDVACNLQGVTGLARAFPVGSKVRVVAQEAAIYKKLTAEDSVIRLEVSYKTDGSIFRNDLGKNIETSADAIYDYRSFSFTMKKPTTPDEERLLSAKTDLRHFELQKDLARLVTAKAETQRLKVMERLVYYPETYYLAYHILAQAYLKPGKKRRALEAKWEEHIQQIAEQIKQATSK